MSTTAGSTAYDDQTRARREGAELWGRTKSLLDERDSLLAEVQRLRAAQPDPALARQCRSADIEALVLRALENATLHAAVMAVHQSFRTKKIRDHLRENKDRYRIEKPPCRRTVKAILIEHGYYF